MLIMTMVVIIAYSSRETEEESAAETKKRIMNNTIWKEVEFHLQPSILHPTQQIKIEKTNELSSRIWRKIHNEKNRYQKGEKKPKLSWMLLYIVNEREKKIAIEMDTMMKETPRKIKGKQPKKKKTTKTRDF